MVEDKRFYDDFRDSIIGSSTLDNVGPSKRISFMLHQYKTIPQRHHKLFCNMVRSYPTSPIFAFIGLGTIGLFGGTQHIGLATIFVWIFESRESVLESLV